MQLHVHVDRLGAARDAESWLKGGSWLVLERTASWGYFLLLGDAGKSEDFESFFSSQHMFFFFNGGFWLVVTFKENTHQSLPFLDLSRPGRLISSGWCISRPWWDAGPVEWFLAVSDLPIATSHGHQTIRNMLNMIIRIINRFRGTLFQTNPHAMPCLSERRKTCRWGDANTNVWAVHNFAMREQIRPLFASKSSNPNLPRDHWKEGAEVLGARNYWPVWMSWESLNSFSTVIIMLFMAQWFPYGPTAGSLVSDFPESSRRVIGQLFLAFSFLA